MPKVIHVGGFEGCGPFFMSEVPLYTFEETFDLPQEGRE